VIELRLFVLRTDMLRLGARSLRPAFGALNRKSSVLKTPF
jgi:hypothetical protein